MNANFETNNVKNKPHTICKNCNKTLEIEEIPQHSRQHFESYEKNQYSYAKLNELISLCKHCHCVYQPNHFEKNHESFKIKEIIEKIHYTIPYIIK
jgi:hypothetical protein